MPPWRYDASLPTITGPLRGKVIVPAKSRQRSRALVSSVAGSGRSAFDDRYCERHLDGAGGGAVAGQLGEQDAHALGAAFLQRLADGGQRDDLGGLRVVEADDGEIAGNSQAKLLGGLQRSDGLHVRGGEDGGWRGSGLEQPSDRFTGL